MQWKLLKKIPSQCIYVLYSAPVLKKLNFPLWWKIRVHVNYLSHQNGLDFSTQEIYVFFVSSSLKKLISCNNWREIVIPKVAKRFPVEAFGVDSASPKGIKGNCVFCGERRRDERSSCQPQTSFDPQAPTSSPGCQTFDPASIWAVMHVAYLNSEHASARVEFIVPPPFSTAVIVEIWTLIISISSFIFDP